MSKNYKLLIILGVLATLVVSFVSFLNLHQLFDVYAARRLEFYEEKQLNLVMMNLINAETGVRGFLLTGRTDYLEPYYNALKTYQQDIESSEKKLRSFHQKTLFQEWKQLIQLKFGFMKQRIQERESTDWKGADIAFLDKGKYIMDNIRRIYMQLLGEKEFERKQKEVEANLAAHHMLWTLILSLFLANGLIALYSYLFYRDNKKIEKINNALSNTSATYETILNNTKQFIIRTDTKGTIIAFNRGAEKALGYKAEEVINQQPVLNLYDPESLYEKLESNRRSGPITFEALVAPSRYLHWLDSEWLMKKKNGSLFPCQQSITAIRNEQNGIIGFLFIGTDISDDKKWSKSIQGAYKAIEAANLSRSKFISSLGHDFRIPLNSILNLASYLEKNKLNHLDQAESNCVSQIVDHTKGLLNLINQIMNLDKADRQINELSLKQVDLNESLQIVLNEVEIKQKEKLSSFRFQVEVPQGVHPLETDPLKFRDILIYLLQVVMESQLSGQIIIRVKASPQTLQAKEIDIIGHSFERKEGEGVRQPLSLSEEQKLHKGTEIASAQALAKSLNYQIVISNRGPKEFILTLLLANKSSENLERDNRQETPSSFENLTILVVDNDKDFREDFIQQLKQLGCSVLSASTGEEALLLARENKVDLITMDMLMAPMNGYDVAQNLRSDQKLKEIPFAFISVIAKEIKGKIPGAIAFVNKPVVREELFDLLHNCLLRQANAQSSLKEPV